MAVFTLRMGVREHQEFMRQLQARADFEITLRVVGRQDLTVEKPKGTPTYRQFELGLRNIGSKAAGPTTINVLMPAWVEAPRWALDEQGHELKESKGPLSAPNERLTDGERDAHEAQYLERTEPSAG